MSKAAALIAARALDAADPLTAFRERFHLPLTSEGRPQLYFCGNSLGLQPRSVRASLEQELDTWARLAVEGHFHGPAPWYDFHEPLARPMADIVGATPEEVVLMGSLTTNLHLLMISFYRPTPERYRIVLEGGAFPSDRYAVQSQAALHGFDPEVAIVVIEPREGEDLLRTEDVEDYLERTGDTVALVMMGGVHYYTGQLLDMARITRAGHRAGARVGFDLAHAAGNAPLALHDWNVDFAAWCTYKYLNSGPGGVGGAFVHARHARAPELPRLAGWWGNDPATRFTMPERFVPQPGAAGWQLSNAPVMTMAPLRASLEIFAEVGLEALRERSLRLTDYLLERLALRLPRVEVITPTAPAARGCQLSLRVPGRDAKALRDALGERGAICDYRSPDVIRMAPVPLYNTFEDLYHFVELLSRLLEESP